MRNWTVGRKLIVGFAVVLAITTALGILAYVNGAGIAEKSEALANEVAPTAVASSEVATEALRGVFDARGYFLYRDTALADSAEQNLRAAAEHMGEIEALAARRGLGDLQREAAEAKGLAENYIQCLLDYFQLRRPGRQARQTRR